MSYGLHLIVLDVMSNTIVLSASATPTMKTMVWTRRKPRPTWNGCQRMWLQRVDDESATIGYHLSESLRGTLVIRRHICSPITRPPFVAPRPPPLSQLARHGLHLYSRQLTLRTPSGFTCEQPVIERPRVLVGVLVCFNCSGVDAAAVPPICPAYPAVFMRVGACGLTATDTLFRIANSRLARALLPLAPDFTTAMSTRTEPWAEKETLKKQQEEEDEELAHALAQSLLLADKAAAAAGVAVPAVDDELYK